MTVAANSVWSLRRQRLTAATVRGFHSYANWLVGISWKRFFLLAVLMMITSGILQNIPPFSWSYTRVVRLPGIDEPPPVAAPQSPQAPPSPKPPGVPEVRIGKPGAPAHSDGVEIVIDDRGVRISPRARPASAAAPAASQASGAAAGASAVPATAPLVEIRLPPGATSDAVREAIAEAKKAIEEAMQEAQTEVAAAKTETEQARAEGRQVASEAKKALRRSRHEVHEVSLGEFLPSLAMLWIVASLIIKMSYKRQIQAEAQAAQAVETAEAESLRRQVVEARMAAMQAQVEPHFLFNTLASIDHLIEVDPPRASQMQKNLIALLRASMPTMREASGNGQGGDRHLGREVAVIRPYLEILKVRMEERLSTEIDLPDGLLSAEFPPMMLQTLVENAIKHGLEPKPEGGKLSIRAEIVHGKLAVSVTDSGLGFGRAASSGKTAGTGVGLANIRERLQLLYGNKASLTITENPGGGTKVTLAVPYKPVEGAHS